MPVRKSYADRALKYCQCMICRISIYAGDNRVTMFGQNSTYGYICSYCATAIQKLKEEE